LADQLHRISFVSGKGGVGKTLLAVNFAWVCAHLGKTLLVDLDFQNQGATGLLSSFIREASRGAIDYILGSEQVTDDAFVKLDANLSFLPAVPLNRPPKHSELFDTCQHPGFKSELACFLGKVGQYGFEIVVLDCHGGLDMVSLASHRLSDHTLVITEPDRVTFNGTLELLDFYQSAPPPTADSTPSDSRCLPEDISRPVELIVNRIPPKYRFADLDRVYGSVLATYKTRLNISGRVLAYIPAEEFVVDSFGEVPFVIPVAPNCVAAQKLHLLAYKLFSDWFAIPPKYKPLSRFASARRRKRVEHTIVSAESRNIRAIVNTFAAISCLYVFLFFGMSSYALLRNSQWEKTDSDLLLGLLCLFVSIVSAVYLKAVFGLNRYYRDKYQIQRNLARTEPGEVSLWRRLAIVRLLLLRAAMLVLPVVVVATLLLFLLITLGWLVTRYR